MNTRNRAGLLLLIVALTALLVAGVAGEARKTGVSGLAVTGCNCHGGGAADTSIKAALDGVPAHYEPGKKYPLTVGVTGGPPYTKAGFDLNVTKGKLTVAAGETNVQISTRNTFGGAPGDATHKTPAGRQWKVDWTAPPVGAGRVSFSVAVNSVNGNDQADILDKWNLLSKPSDEKNVAPQPVSLLPAKQTAAGTVNLTWTKEPDADLARYEVHKGTRPAFPLTTASKVLELKEREQTSAQVTGLSENTTYHFRIRVVDKGGLSTESNEIAFLVQPVAAPEPEPAARAKESPGASGLMLGLGVVAVLVRAAAADFRKGPRVAPLRAERGRQAW